MKVEVLTCSSSEGISENVKKLGLVQNVTAVSSGAFKKWEGGF